jgi:opacity protein-like surface antigen
MRTQIMTSLALTALITTLASAESSLDEFSRAGQWEAYGFGQAIVVTDVFESDATMAGGGVGIGYNVLEHLNINGDFSINSMELDSDPLFGDSEEISRTLYLGSISLDYNILKTRVTPFVTAGAQFGFTSEDSGVAVNPNLGLGVRWDASERIFLKLAIRAIWWDAFDHTITGDAAGVGVSLAVGYKF